MNIYTHMCTFMYVYEHAATAVISSNCFAAIVLASSHLPLFHPLPLLSLALDSFQAKRSPHVFIVCMMLSFSQYIQSVAACLSVCVCLCAYMQNNEWKIKYGVVWWLEFYTCPMQKLFHWQLKACSHSIICVFSCLMWRKKTFSTEINSSRSMKLTW